MNALKISGVFYLLYTIYTFVIVMVSDYTILHSCFGLLSMWMLYFVMLFGYSYIPVKDRETHNTEEWGYIHYPFSEIAGWPASRYGIVALIAWAAAIISAKFYTGKGLSAVLAGALGGADSYNQYQKYFLEHIQGTSIVTKLPFILMLAFLVVLMAWSVLSVLLYDNNITFYKLVYLAAVILAYMYLGIARGTNFETYFVFITIAYCLLQKLQGGLNARTLTYLLVMIAGAILLVIVYRRRVMDRGYVFTSEICPEIHIDQGSFLVQTFPALVLIGISLFGYLGYGIFCMGVTAADICLADMSSFLASLLPGGFKFLKGASLPELLRQTIDVGVKWVPDYVVLLGALGLPLLLTAAYLTGRLLKDVDNLDAPGFMKNVFNLIVYIEMLALPVGNFILSSSANKIMVLFVIIWLIQYCCIRIKLYWK